MNIVHSGSGMSVKAPDAHGPGYLAVQTIHVDFKRPDDLPPNVMDSVRSVWLTVTADGVTIGWNTDGFIATDVDPEARGDRLHLQPTWKRGERPLPTNR